MKKLDIERIENIEDYRMLKNLLNHVKYDFADSETRKQMLEKKEIYDEPHYKDGKSNISMISDWLSELECNE